MLKRRGQKWILEEFFKIHDVFSHRNMQYVEGGFKWADVKRTSDRIKHPGMVRKEWSKTARQQEEMVRTARKNLEEGNAYLEENKTGEGVNVTESGLQYKVLKEGDGRSPGESDRIMVHYKGTKLNGTVFDSSYERGEPATFQVDQVIQGWTEGVQLMNEGGKYRLFIPANLAYGEGGAGQEIGPNEVLIFEVELLEVVYSQPMDS